MKIFINPNITKLHHIETIKEVVETLDCFTDLECILDKQVSNEVFGSDKYCHYQVSDAQIIVSIGGDGTLLRSAKLALENDLPIVGINAGRLGYLCKYKVDDILKARENPFKEYKISNRELLKLNYHNSEYIALNDFVFASLNTGYTIELEAKIKDETILYHSSGLIVATPTGSTAYNVAAGGSMIDADVKANVVTPICPCNHEHRSRVFGSDLAIQISNHRNSDPVNISADGVIIGIMDEPLMISKYAKSLKLIV